ncbi:MAG: hypothetical protein WC412_04615 [Candidatus Omnitrophota bacterium]
MHKSFLCAMTGWGKTIKKLALRARVLTHRPLLMNSSFFQASSGEGKMIE